MCLSTQKLMSFTIILDYNNPQSLLSDDLRKFMDSMGTQIPACVNCSTVYYDAWTNDDNDDPILALVYATIASKQSNYSSEIERSLSDLVGKILDAVTARPISDVFKQVKGENSFAPVKKRENIHSLIHEFLDELILCQRRFKIVGKRRRNFVVFRRG